MTRKLSTGHLPALGEDMLSPREIQMVEGYLAGHSQERIAGMLNMTQQGVSKALNRPHVLRRIRELLGQRDLAAEDRLKGLLPKAVTRLDKELENPDARVGLRAADRVLKATGKYQHQVQENRPRAEEVIGRFMQGISIEHEHERTTVTAVRTEDVSE